MERKLASFVHFEAAQDVGFELEVLIVCHQAGIAVVGHHPHVFGTPHEHTDAPAMTPDTTTLRLKINDLGR